MPQYFHKKFGNGTLIQEADSTFILRLTSKTKMNLVGLEKTERHTK